jgi:hypothetical protein
LIWVQKGFLLVHLVGLGLYIGFQATIILVNRRIRAAREADDAAEELTLVRLIFGLLVIANCGLILLLASGLGLSIVVGYGFFSAPWLTVKHLAVLAMFFNTIRIPFVMNLLGRKLKGVSGPPIPEDVRRLVDRRKPFDLFNQVMVGIILVSALFRF